MVSQVERGSKLECGKLWWLELLASVICVTEEITRPSHTGWSSDSRWSFRSWRTREVQGILVHQIHFREACRTNGRVKAAWCICYSHRKHFFNVKCTFESCTMNKDSDLKFELTVWHVVVSLDEWGQVFLGLRTAATTTGKRTDTREKRDIGYLTES